MHRGRCEEKGVENETVKGGGGCYDIGRATCLLVACESGSSGDAAVVRGLARNGGPQGGERWWKLGDSRLD